MSELGDEAEIKTVIFIFEERVKGVACVLIARSLNEKGVPPPQRGRWRNTDRKWNVSTINGIIANPAYYGARAYNRFSSSKIVAQKKQRDRLRSSRYPAWKNPVDEWHLVENAHPGIVSKETWEKANAENRTRPKRKPNGSTYHSQYLLSGLIRCSKCGFTYQGWSGTVRGKVYRRYIDGGYQQKRGCKFKSIPKDVLEEFAVRSIKQTLMEPDLLSRIESRLRNMLEGNRGEQSERIGLLNQSLVETEKKIGNLLKLAENGSVSGDSVRIRVNELEGEKRRIEAEISVAVVPPPRPNYSELGQEVAKFILNFEENFEKAPMEERKLLIQSCISEIVVDREANVARFYIRQVPALRPALVEATKTKENEERVMSNPRARNRT